MINLHCNLLYLKVLNNPEFYAAIFNMILFATSVDIEDKSLGLCCYTTDALKCPQAAGCFWPKAPV